MICGNCGKQLDDDSLFCTYCGMKLDEIQNKKFCANCGNELDDDAVFCSKCGYKIQHVEANTVSAENEKIETQTNVRTNNTTKIILFWIVALLIVFFGIIFPQM